MKAFPFETWPTARVRVCVGSRPTTYRDPPAVRKYKVLCLHRVETLAVPPGESAGVRRSKLRDLAKGLKRAQNVWWRVTHDLDAAHPGAWLGVMWDRPGGCRGGVFLCMTQVH
jgi:hypothetical protein